MNVGAGAQSAMPDREALRRVAADAVTFLHESWDESRHAYPSALRLIGSSVQAEFEEGEVLGSTMLALLGLLSAARARLDVTERLVTRRLEEFSSRWSSELTHPRDWALWTILMSESGDEDGVQKGVRGLSALHPAATIPLDVHALAAWALARAAGSGVRSAESRLEAFGSTLADRIDPHTGLPRPGGGGRVAFFDEIAFSVRALHELAIVTGEPAADRRVRQATAAICSTQGRLGEWPWLIDVRSGRPVHVYPLFTPHQDALAMLFLHPLLDRGDPGAHGAIASSLGWASGRNELGRSMYVPPPLFAYRGIEKRWFLRRQRRLVRSRLNAVLGLRPKTIGAARLQLNPDCLPDHPGWFLTVWSSRL